MISGSRTAPRTLLHLPRCCCVAVYLDSWACVTAERGWRMASGTESANVAYSDDRDYGASRQFSPIAIDLHPHLCKCLLPEARTKLGENEARRFESIHCCRNRLICSESSTAIVPFLDSSCISDDVWLVMARMLMVVEQVWLNQI